MSSVTEDMNPTQAPVTQPLVSDTPHTEVVRVKRERTESQVKALERARNRAL